MKQLFSQVASLREQEKEAQGMPEECGALSSEAF